MELIDRPHGWTLKEALSELQVEVFRFVFASSAKAGYQRDHGRQVAWEGIAPQLERGELHATGILSGKTTPAAIHSSFAADAVPDFGKNTLSLNGTVYAGVRVWRGAGAGGTLRPMPGRTTDIADAEVSIAEESPENRAARWMRENVTKYVAKQRDRRVQECKSAAAVSQKQALQGWNLLPEAIKGPSRRPK